MIELKNGSLFRLFLIHKFRYPLFHNISSLPNEGVLAQMYLKLLTCACGKTTLSNEQNEIILSTQNIQKGLKGFLINIRMNMSVFSIRRGLDNMTVTCMIRIQDYP